MTPATLQRTTDNGQRTTALQLNMFGPPEPLNSYPGELRYHDDAPVPSERQLLWPMPHAEALGPDLLERLYGDLSKRTRLTVMELCRFFRCGHSHIYNLVEAGSLDALDARHPAATQNCLTIYRYSVIRFLFHREFVENCTRGNMPPEDLARCLRLADQLRAQRSKHHV